MLERAQLLELAQWLGTRLCNGESTALEVEMTRALRITSHSLEQLARPPNRARIVQDRTMCGERVQTRGAGKDLVTDHHPVPAVKEARVEVVGWTPSVTFSAIRDSCALRYRMLLHGLAFDENGSIAYRDEDHDLDSMYHYISETFFNVNYVK